MKFIKNSKKSQIFLQLIADIIAIWLGFAIQSHLRFFSGMIDTFATPTLTDYVFGSSMMTCFWMVTFAMFGMYKDWYISSLFSEFYSIIKVSFFGCLIIVFLLLADNSNSFRALFLVYFCISVFTFTFFRFITRRIQIYLRNKGIVKISTIIIGNLKHSIEFYKNTLKNKSWGYDIKGIILYERKLEDKEFIIENNIDETLILGTINDVNSMIDNSIAAEVVLSSGTPNSKLLFEIENICQTKNIRLSIFPNLYDHFTGRTKTQNIYGIPLIEVSFGIIKPIQSAIKRIFDITFSLLVLVLGLPFWILIALIIRLESSGKAIYTQPRIGKNNKVFTIYKFRSMTQDKTKNSDVQQWTIKNDPRVTKFGKFIRKTHLDEIPQFFNIFIGDMSVVGPRPEQPKFVEEFSKQLIHYNRRHLVRPGLTGWHQIHLGNYELGLDEIKKRTKNDFYYIENFSLQFDFEIIVRTIWRVLLGKGQT